MPAFEPGSFHIKWTKFQSRLNLTPSKKSQKNMCCRTSCIRSAGKNSGSCMKYWLRYQLLSIRLTTDQNHDPYSGRDSANCENPADRSTYNMNGISSVTFCVDCKFARRFCITPTVFCLLVDKIIENLTMLTFICTLKSAEDTSINGRIPHT
jgi:hypothetical protein